MTQFVETTTDALAALTELLGDATGITVKEHFPEAGRNHLVSSLTCQLFIGDRETPEETFVLTSLMTILRSEPYVNAQGLRQIDGHLESWTAKGFSTTLNRTIEYVLSPDAQPMSEFIAEQPTSDFPAEVTFRSKFDVLVDGQIVLKGIDGTAHGTGWMSIPPDGDDVLTVDKTVMFGPARIVSLVCSSSAGDPLIVVNS